MKNLFILSLTVFMFTSLLNATDKNNFQYEVPLAGSGLAPQERLISRPADSFVSDQHIDWSISYDKYTARPYMGIGKPAKIEGFNAVNNENIVNAALNYIADNDDMFHINVEYLSFIRAKDVNGKWYVTFYQKYGELEVLLSEVELRINQKAEVFAFRIQYFDFEEPEQIKLSYGQAVDKAISSVSKKLDKNDVLLSDKNSDKMYILPIRIKNGVQAKRVYKVDYKVKSEPASLTSYVDANSGDIIWQYNNIHDYKKTIKAEGLVFPVSRLGESEVLPFAHQRVRINQKSYDLDENGELEIELGGDNISISGNLESKYCNIINISHAQAEINSTISKDGNLLLHWKDNNSHSYERNMFYHFHKVREWVKNIDPNTHGLDKNIPITLEWDTSYYKDANAYFSPLEEAITFIALDNKNYRMPEVPTILYHEYGHAINHFVYVGEGAIGMRNRAVHEGTADVMAAFVADTSVPGYGASVKDPNENRRGLDNNNQYPDSISGESHHDGMILSGAFWDLRMLTDLETATNLLHFTRYGLPDDTDTGIAFSEWFIEVLITDDDDGDLSNGTPHFKEIVEAFNRHGIGSGLLLYLNFDHEPADISEIPVGKYNITVKAPIEGMFKVSDLEMVYSFDDFATSSILELPDFTASEMNIDIPQFDKPGIWKYYFRGVDNISNDTIVFSRSLHGLSPYSVLVAYHLIIKDDFEEESNWKLDEQAKNDKLVPKWIRVIPKEKGKGKQRLGYDHTENGQYCYSTGNDTTYSYASLFSSGFEQKLYSPVYNLSNSITPVVRFYYWLKEGVDFSGNTGGYVPFLNLEYKLKNQNEWVLINRISEKSTDRWNQVLYYLPDEITKSSSVQFRFTAEAVIYSINSFSQMNVMIDDFEILHLAPVGVEDDKKKQENIYPNPVRDILNISDELQLEYSRYEVVDILGNTIVKGKLTSTALNIQGIGTGTYFLRLLDEGNRRSEFKFVKE